MGAGWGESALLAQSSDLSASECDIRVSTRGGALLIMWWGGARVVEFRWTLMQCYQFSSVHVSFSQICAT